MARIARLVEEACAGLAALPAAERQDFKASLIALHDDLDRLGGEIRRRHSELKRELGELSAQKRARSAYAKKPGGEKKS